MYQRQVSAALAGLVRQSAWSALGRVPVVRSAHAKLRVDRRPIRTKVRNRNSSGAFSVWRVIRPERPKSARWRRITRDSLGRRTCVITPGDAASRSPTVFCNVYRGHRFNAACQFSTTVYGKG